MARPKIVRTKDGGEILLKNCDPDLAAKIKAMVQGAVEDQPVATQNDNYAPPEPGYVVTACITSELDKFALSTFLKDGKWFAVTLKYNSDTKEATVESSEDCGGMRHVAIDKFKILAIKHHLV